jgi:Putative Actinobacterial Holin-X, holin superfamily III
VSSAPGGDPRAGQRTGPEAGPPLNVATALTDVSERVAVLVREEVELAKAEVTEKASRLARGAVVGVVAGVFFFTALFFVLIGCAWLLYYYLPVGSDFTYFWGFFAMALILVVLGVLAGLLAARAVKKGAPPVPTQAIEEARLIRETLSTSYAEQVPASPGAAPAGPYSAGGASPAGGPTGAGSDSAARAGIYRVPSDGGGS